MVSRDAFIFILSILVNLQYAIAWYDWKADSLPFRPKILQTRASKCESAWTVLKSEFITCSKDMQTDDTAVNCPNALQLLRYLSKECAENDTTVSASASNEKPFSIVAERQDACKACINYFEAMFGFCNDSQCYAAVGGVILRVALPVSFSAFGFSAQSVYATSIAAYIQSVLYKEKVSIDSVYSVLHAVGGARGKAIRAMLDLFLKWIVTTIVKSDVAAQNRSSEDGARWVCVAAPSANNTDFNSCLYRNHIMGILVSKLSRLFDRTSVILLNDTPNFVERCTRCAYMSLPIYNVTKSAVTVATQATVKSITNIVKQSISGMCNSIPSLRPDSIMNTTRWIYSGTKDILGNASRKVVEACDKLPSCSTVKESLINMDLNMVEAISNSYATVVDSLASSNCTSDIVAKVINITTSTLDHVSEWVRNINQTTASTAYNQTKATILFTKTLVGDAFLSAVRSGRK